MKKPIVLLWLALIGLFLVGTYSACTDFTTIGSDLLEEDRLGLDYVDTITLVTTSVSQDSVLVYSGSNFSAQLNRHLFGDFNDPVFGRVEAGIYTQVLLNQDRGGFFPVTRPPDFENVVFDSIVLVMTLDSSRFYGSPTQAFELEVFRLTEAIDASKDYYSNVSFATESVPLGSAQFFPRLDSLEVIDYRNFLADTISFPHVRIPLDPALASELIQIDTLIYQSDTTFIEVFKGLYIKSKQATDGLVAFNLRAPFSNQDRSLIPGIYLYYSDATGQPRQYQFEMNDFAARISSFKHEYAGAPAAALINNATSGDNLLLLQGLAGIDVKIELPHVVSLQGTIVNYAELEIPLGTLPDDEPGRYAPAGEVFLSAFNSRGVLEPISDVLFAGNQRINLFGGVYIKGADGKPDVYRMNVSSQIADMINGRAPNEMFLQVLFKAQSAGRSILNGPKHPDNRMRLKVAFTKI